MLELTRYCPGSAARGSLLNKTAEQCLKSIDAAYPVADGDPDVASFQALASKLVSRIFAHVHRHSDEAFDVLLRQSQSDRILGIPFLRYIRRRDPNARAYCERIFKSMPRKTQQVLGRANLRPIDLLDLPTIPINSSVWLNYINTIASMPGGACTDVPLPSMAKKNPKSDSPVFQTYRDGYTALNAQSFAIYNSSSYNKLGDAQRILDLVKKSNIDPGVYVNEDNHTAMLSPPDNVLNFRTINVVPNSSKSSPVTEGAKDDDVEFLEFVDGLVTLFLAVGMKVSSISHSSQHRELTERGLNFQLNLRRGLPLPDFSNESPSKTWSMACGHLFDLPESTQTTLPASTITPTCDSCASLSELSPHPEHPLRRLCRACLVLLEYLNKISAEDRTHALESQRPTRVPLEQRRRD
ncbi:hypothetical protein PG994_013003 [Apiospora phragmitis]|uniref:Uncharacterized protein n=1 Tax=Apiospora phragmitis TaxID=2905665 RepID=A0ABR1T7E4_9PEZI